MGLAMDLRNIRGGLWLTLAFVLYYKGVFGACPVGWTEINNECYSVEVPSQPFNDIVAARMHCDMSGADLVTVPDQAVVDFIRTTVQAIAESSRPAYVYIGLNDLDTEDTFIWVQGDPVTYNVTVTDSPQSHADDCVAMRSVNNTWDVDPEWVEVACCFPDPVPITAVACSKPDDSNVTMNLDTWAACYGGCGDGWVRQDGMCYRLFEAVNANMSEYENIYYARQRCVAEDAELLSFVNPQDQIMVQRIIAHGSWNATPTALFHSFNDITMESQFVNGNGDQDNATFASWATGEPDATNAKDCTLVQPDADWDSQVWSTANCCNHSVTHVMCQKPADGAVSYPGGDNDPFAIECYGHIDECESSPCVNDATCVDKVKEYNCTCVYGYTGVNCETDIDFCESNPCENGATCQDQLAGYVCDCPNGYTGVHCETMFDACVVAPCKNNATCHDFDDHSGGYNCTCNFGFTGSNCETNIDECATMNITCLNGGTCMDDIGDAYCNCVSGYFGDSCETQVICSPPIPTVANATSNQTGDNNYGATVILICKPGHKFPDGDRVKNLTCADQSPNWSGYTTDPCEIHCDEMPYVPNAIPSTDSTRYGVLVNFTCAKGFQYADNSTVMNMTCLDHGEWNQETENITGCEVVKCPALPIYEHQDMDTTNNTYNTTVTFWCDVGYVLHDNTTARTIKCLASGEWTAELPECKPIKCPEIKEIEMGSRNTSARTYNTYVQYTCDNGKRMLDGATYRILKCDATGEWSDNVTDCDPNRCFPLPYVANATPSALDASFGSKIILTCIKGHKFLPETEKVDKKHMICHNDQRWRPILASCEPIVCPELPIPAKCSRSTNNTLYGTVADYTCDKGHYYPNVTDMEGVRTIECLETENWNNTDLPDCEPIICPLPPDIRGKNGTRTPDSLHPRDVYDITYDYRCDEGFLFIDGRRDRQIRCNEVGQWNTVDVSCRIDRCIPVPEVANTTVDTTNTSWYTNVTYTCLLGYYWNQETYPNKTSHRIMCQNDGTWTTPEAPPCDIKHCDDLEDMLFASTNTSYKWYDHHVEYQCDIGYKYYVDNETSHVRRCNAHAKWEPLELPTDSIQDDYDFPKCEIVHCPELPEVENATRNSNDTEYDTVVTYECMTGYQYPDSTKNNQIVNKTVTCTANETWTELPPPCEVKFCPPLPIWGDMEFNSTDNDFDAVVTYWCKEEFMFTDKETDPKTTICTFEKVWIPALVDCKPTSAINADLIGVTYESPKAVSIGTIACSLLCCFGAAIVLLDLNKLYTDIKMMKSNIQDMMKRRQKNRVGDSSTAVSGNA